MSFWVFMLVMVLLFPAIMIIMEKVRRNICISPQRSTEVTTLSPTLMGSPLVSVITPSPIATTSPVHP